MAPNRRLHKLRSGVPLFLYELEKSQFIITIYRGVGGVEMPDFQTKALAVTTISGDNFRLIPLYSWLCTCAPKKLNFLYCKGRPLPDALSNVYQTEVWFVRYTRDQSHCME